MLTIASRQKSCLEISGAEEVISLPFNSRDQAIGKSKSFRVALAKVRSEFVMEKLYEIGVPKARIREGPILNQSGYGAYIKLIEECYQEENKTKLPGKEKIEDSNNDSYDFLGQGSSDQYFGIHLRKRMLLDDGFVLRIGVGIGKTQDYILTLEANLEYLIDPNFSPFIATFVRDYNLLENEKIGLGIGFTTIINQTKSSSIFLEVELQDSVDVEASIGIRF